MTSTLRRWILGISTACALAVGSGSAYALTIDHNGFPETDIPGSGDVDVALTGEFIGLCGSIGGSIGVDLCLEKIWLPGSEDQVHTITLSETGDEPLLFLEFVLNATGVPWTDYHFAISEDDFLICCEAGIFDIDSLELVGLPDIVFDGATSVSFFFDPPLDSIDLDGFDGFEFLAFFAFIGPVGDSVTITQFPTIPEPAALGLLGLGLVGIALLRRRAAA